MKKYFSILMLGIAAMLASCSQEEMLQDATNHSRTTTVTATISDGMKTRASATSEELAAITRCKLVVYAKGETTNPVADETVNVQNNDNSFTFNLDLNEGEYDFYCWADDGSSYNIGNGLGNITVAEGKNPSIAHEGKITANSGSQVDIALKHAVAKVVLATTKDIEADKSASVTVQSYSGYSVFTESVTGNAEALLKNITTTATNGASETDPAEVLSFYVLVDKNEEPQASVTVAYGDDGIEIANVPIKADCRTILKGDLTALAYPATTVTATLDTSWENDTEQAFTTIVNSDTYTITLAKAGTLTEDDIKSAMYMGYGMGTLKISGPMNDNDIQTLSGYLKTISDNEISLELTNASFESLPAEAFKDVKWLTWIYLPSTLKTIGNSAFEGCARLAVVEGLKNVKTVGSKAFKDVGTEILNYQITFELYSATSIGAYAFQGIGGAEIVAYLLSGNDIDVTDAFKTEDGGTMSEHIVLFLNETKIGEVTIVENAYKIWKGYTFDGIGFTTP